MGCSLTLNTCSPHLLNLKTGIQHANVHVAVHGADASLFNLSWKFCSKCQDKEWQQREEGAGTKKDNGDRSCWKGLFSCKNFQGLKRETFVCYSFQMQKSFVTLTGEIKELQIHF